MVVEIDLNFFFPDHQARIAFFPAATTAFLVSEKIENLGQFFEKLGKRGLNINVLAKFTIMKKKQ